jgi:hypothetical protein
VSNEYRIIERLDAIEKVVVGIDARMKGLRCGEHDAFIDGNGHPGAKQRLGLLEKSVAELENHDLGVVEARVSELDGFRRDAKRLFVAIVGFICIQVGLAAWNHLVAPTERPAPAAVERTTEVRR